MSWYLYIIKTKKNKLYTGISKDYLYRFLQHLSGNGGAKYFRSDEPDQIVYLETHTNRSQASIAEAMIKKMSSEQKRRFIKEHFPNSQL
jgi:putative endonuclease